MVTTDRREDVRLSVVIPCLDEGDTIASQLDGLAEETWSEPWEVVVADNGSTDGTREIVNRYRERIPNLRLIDASSRPGSCFARNAGAAAARGELIAFCDADDEIQPGWLAAMGDALRAHEVVAGRLDSVRLNDPGLVRALGAWQDEGLNPFGRYLPYASSSNLGVRHALHARIGGFDEDFLGAAHDIDYSWRLQQAGAEIFFEPRAVTSYRFRRGPLSLYRQGRFYALGFVSVYKKHRQHLPRQRHPLLLGALSWLGLGRRLPIPPSMRSLETFAWSLGWKLGMLEGSVRHRVLLLSIRGIV